MTRARDRERGFALLLVLWTMVLLALLASRVTATGRGEAQLSRNLSLAAAAQEAADGAIAATAFHLREAGAAQWPVGAAHTLTIGPAAVTVTTRTLDGLINPNTASPALLAALLHVIGATDADAARLAAAILAWRAPVDQPRTIAAAYRAAGLDYAPPEAPLQQLDELRLVLGMTPPLYDALAPHLSLFADEPPTRTTADPIVAAALRLAGDTEGPRPAGIDERPVVEIIATATTHAGARFTRQAVLRLADGMGARPFQTLAWRAP